MIKISEFNPSISNKKESSTSANCKVIINNSPNVSTATSTLEPIPETIESLNTSATPTLNNYVPEYTTSNNLMLRENDLFKHLAVSFSNIL